MIKSLGMIKVLTRSIPKHNKSNISKPIVNIKLNSQYQMKTISPKSVMRQGCLLSSYLFNIILEYIARAIRQLKKTNKGDTNWK